MSRNKKDITSSITLWFGDDHAIGNWFDITDERFAMSGKDEQGEGYVFEWSEMFPQGTNHINYQMPEIFDFDNEQHIADIIQKCNEFINILYNEN